MNWKWFFISLAIAILLSVGVGLLYPVSAYYYVEQGSTVYLDQSVDISGIAIGIENLAYYDGYDCYGDTQYLLTMPKLKSGYYNFTIDRSIFSGRLGLWCKWNGYVESNGNLKAFVVVAKRKAVLNQTENETLQNPNQIPVVVPRTPYLPKKHISDYVIARGNGFNLTVNGTTSVWIFGYREGIYDYKSFNGSVNIAPETINTLSPGKYTVMLLTQAHGFESVSTVRYNNETRMLDWFDPVSFGINHYDLTGQTPENIMAKIQEISPSTHTEYTTFNLEVQPVSISIDQIDSLNALNATGYTRDLGGVSLEEPGYIDVRGYTNVAPDTVIKVVVDPNFQLGTERIWRDAIATAAEGELGGDMREFKVIVPVDKYNMGPGRHFVAARTGLSDAYVTADFYIYENPEGNFIPNKTIRYISGKYGPEELVPTPTPVVVIKEVPVTVVKTVTIPVTPSNEQVYAQQKLVQDKVNEENWVKIGAILVVVGSITLVAMGVRYGIKVYRRARKC